MIRLLTAAAVAVLLSTPVMAQNVSPSDRYDPSVQNQGSYGSPGTSSPGSSSSESMSNQGLSNQAPVDCLPNDPRPACQTAQMPSQEPGTSSAPPADWSSERPQSSPDGMSSPSAPPSGTMDR